MTENFTALTKGCSLFMRLFEKPANILIVIYLARVAAENMDPVRRSRTYNQIIEEVCKNPGIDKNDAHWGIVNTLIPDNWIKKVNGERSGGETRYKTTDQGISIAKFLKQENIINLFRNS